MRIVFGIIAGLLVMSLVVGGMEVAGHVLFGAPGQQTLLLVTVLAAYFLGVLAGGSVAVRIAQARWAAWVIAAAVLAGALWSMTRITQPGWMSMAAIAAPLLGGFLAARLALPYRRGDLDARP